MMTHHVKQHRTNGDALANVDVDKRSGGLWYGGGGHQTLLVEQVVGARSAERAGPHGWSQTDAAPVAISHAITMVRTVGECRTGCACIHRHVTAPRDTIRTAEGMCHAPL